MQTSEKNVGLLDAFYNSIRVFLRIMNMLIIRLLIILIRLMILLYNHSNHSQFLFAELLWNWLKSVESFLLEDQRFLSRFLSHQRLTVIYMKHITEYSLTYRYLQFLLTISFLNYFMILYFIVVHPEAWYEAWNAKQRSREDPRVYCWIKSIYFLVFLFLWIFNLNLNFSLS